MTDPQLTLFAPPLDHHQRLLASVDRWRCCQFAGIQPSGTGLLYELRQCPECQSTISRLVPRDEALRILAEQIALLSRTLELMDPA